MSAPKADAARPTVGIVGGGTWGLALALGASRAGADALLYSRRAPEGLEGVRVTHALPEIAEAGLLVVAVPSSVAREVLRSLGDHLDGRHLLIHGVRGLDMEHLETISDIARDETPVRRVGAIGGPVQADELASGRPSAMVCGSAFPEVIAAVTRTFQHDLLRVYGTPDLRGLEWASALVGCMAVGVGFVKASGAGPGLLAALISRGVEEAARIAAAVVGAEERTMFGLGGYGDLLASIGLDSRPEVVLGAALARGRTLAEATSDAQLRVEAVELIPRIDAFAKESGVKAPTFSALVEILRGAPGRPLLDRMFLT